VLVAMWRDNGSQDAGNAMSRCQLGESRFVLRIFFREDCKKGSWARRGLR